MTGDRSPDQQVPQHAAAALATGGTEQAAPRESLQPYQRWHHPPGCPDADWCAGNRVCYWDCQGSDHE